MKRRELTELLAYRDGDDPSLTPERRAELAADPDVPAQLARLAAVAHGLRNLPERPPDAMVWAMVAKRLRARRNGHAPRYRRYVTALAAGVGALVVAALFWITPVDRAEEVSVAELIGTSQQLERSWLARSQHVRGASVVHSALLYRIANVDSQLNQLAAEGAAPRADVQALWRKRVALLQSLLEVDEGDQVQYTTL